MKCIFIPFTEVVSNFCFLNFIIITALFDIFHKELSPNILLCFIFFRSC